MDGIHDLGGKQGFGRIPINDNVIFEHDWERRLWGMTRNGVTPGITIDWFRHGVENLVPTDYLNFAYFNKWTANVYMLLIDGDVVTMAEALSGHMDTPHPAAETKSYTDVIAHNRASDTDFERPATTAPKFSIGDTITTLSRSQASHTRLPAYARGATGTVITYHGAHLLPEKGVQGIHEGEHLYTVSFKAVELWGADANPRDTVTLELWESYFV